VSYTPIAPGTEGANLTLFTDGPDPQPVAILSGSAESLPPCNSQVSDPFLNFGRVYPGQTKSLSFSISNVGQADCLVDGLRIAPDVAAAQDGGAPPFSLPGASTWYRIVPGAQLGVQVEFAAPESAPGGPDFSGQVEFTLSNPSAPSWVVALTGSSG
jgi:hypothetical protein